MSENSQVASNTIKYHIPMMTAEGVPATRRPDQDKYIDNRQGIIGPQPELIMSPLELAIEHYRLVMAYSAVRAWETKENAYASGTPDDVTQKRLKVSLDNNATFTGRDGFTMTGWPIGLDAQQSPVPSQRPNIMTNIDAFEGEKEIIKDGVDAQVIVLKGEYRPSAFIEGNTVVRSSVAVDIVECTTLLSKDKPRSMSVLAGIVDGEILPTASEKEWRYTEVWVANPNLVGYVSSENTVTQNILNTMEKYGLTDPKEVVVRILGKGRRPRNQAMIDEALAAGATVEELSDGDMAAMIHTIMTDGPYMNLGSGGSPEARIMAALARARKAQYEARNVAVDDNGSVVKTGEVYKAENVIKGDPDSIFLTAVGINGEGYLDLAPISGTFVPDDSKSNEPDNGEAYWDVDTITITSNQVNRMGLNISAA